MNGKRTANVERANREKINRRKKMTKMMRNHRESGRERERNCEYDNGDDDDDHNDDTK